MRLIRITLVGLALAAAAARTAAAQQDASAETRAGSKRAMLLMDIELDSTRQAKIDSVMAKYRPEVQALRGQGRPRDNAGREKKRRLMERQLADLRTFLTPEQRRIFDRNVAKMRGSRGDQSPPASQP